MGTTPQTFSDLAGIAVQYLDTATGLLIVGAIVVYFWGITNRLFKERSGSTAEWGTYLLWGVIIIALMVSIVGVVNILQKSIFGGSL